MFMWWCVWGGDFGQKRRVVGVVFFWGGVGPLFVMTPFRLRTGDHYYCLCTDLLKIYCVCVKQHAGLLLPV